jgi:hypothetical protein
LGARRAGRVVMMASFAALAPSAATWVERSPKTACKAGSRAVNRTGVVGWVGVAQVAVASILLWSELKGAG